MICLLVGHLGMLFNHYIPAFCRPIRQIITPDQTIKCGAMSADGLQMWLSAIIHASTLPT